MLVEAKQAAPGPRKCGQEITTIERCTGSHSAYTEMYCRAWQVPVGVSMYTNFEGAHFWSGIVIVTASNADLVDSILLACCRCPEPVWTQSPLEDVCSCQFAVPLHTTLSAVSPLLLQRVAHGHVPIRWLPAAVAILHGQTTLRQTAAITLPFQLHFTGTGH